MKSYSLPKRRQSVGEEIANAVSHGIGSLLAMIAALALVAGAAQRGRSVEIIGASIFGTTMVVGRFSSLRLKIFLLIAGTYTPFTLGPLRGNWGWTLLVLVWGLAVAGVVFKAVGGVGYPRLSTSVYVVMGWLVIVAIEPLRVNMPLPGLLWLLAGGIAYTAGIAFFAPKRLRYSHLVWHLCVIVGTACHFAAALWYAV